MIRLYTWLSATTAITTCLIFNGTALAEIAISAARVNEGQLVLKGTTAPNAQITLDGGVARTTASATGAFDFGKLYYVPSSCMVELTSPGQTTVYTKVRSCSTLSLQSSGAWNNTSSYVPNDLVTHKGSTYRARQAVPGNVVPGPTTSSYWELFSASGMTGPTGPAGATGSTGPAGPAGATGSTGPAGPGGANGSRGPAGPRGGRGSVGPAGPSFILGQVQNLTPTSSVYVGQVGVTGASPSEVEFVVPVGTTFTSIWCAANLPVASFGVQMFRNGNLEYLGCGATGATGPIQGSGSVTTNVGDRVSFYVQNYGGSSTTISWGIK